MIDHDSVSRCLSLPCHEHRSAGDVQAFGLTRNAFIDVQMNFIVQQSSRPIIVEQIIGILGEYFGLCQAFRLGRWRRLVLFFVAIRPPTSQIAIFDDLKASSSRRRKHCDLRGRLIATKNKPVVVNKKVQNAAHALKPRSGCSCFVATT